MTTPGKLSRIAQHNFRFHRVILFILHARQYSQ